MISVQHLTKRFGGRVAVDDLSFDVKAGEVLGFLGPNGAGKTTTMRMIAGYLPATRGRVSIEGFDVLEEPLEAKRRIGYLPENPPLYPEMTVRRYLEFVSAIKDVPAGRRAAAVDRAIGRARLDEVRDKRLGQLSKGFKQRVGLAQAIVHEPPVLILDEPTSSLDPKQRVEVRDLIVELRGSHTVILSTHILPEVSGIADRVFILNRGRVVAVDTPANLARRLQGRRVVTAEIQGSPPPADAVRGALAAIAGVDACAIERADFGALRARLETDSAVDVRAEVAAVVVNRGWRLLGLAAESLSLEDIFLTLTKEE